MENMVFNYTKYLNNLRINIDTRCIMSAVVLYNKINLKLIGFLFPTWIGAYVAKRKKRQWHSKSGIIADLNDHPDRNKSVIVSADAGTIGQ